MQYHEFIKRLYDFPFENTILTSQHLCGFTASLLHGLVANTVYIPRLHITRVPTNRKLAYVRAGLGNIF